jgi:hypothetical protein
VRNNPEDSAETKKELKELEQTMRQTPPREADNANVRKLETESRHNHMQEVPFYHHKQTNADI